MTHLRADDIIDKRGYLKIVFKSCPWGHSRLGCAVKPYVNLHPDGLDETAARDILQKHFDCPKTHDQTSATH